MYQATPFFSLKVGPTNAGALFFLLLFFLSCQGGSTSSGSNKKEIQAAILSGEKLIQQSDCYQCHHVTNASAGPSFVQIARRYDNNPAAISMLSEKIIAGGVGVWGQSPMMPHPSIYRQDAELMVKYILSQQNESY